MKSKITADIKKGISPETPGVIYEKLKRIYIKILKIIVMKVCNTNAHNWEYLLTNIVRMIPRCRTSCQKIKIKLTNKPTMISMVIKFSEDTPNIA